MSRFDRQNFKKTPRLALRVSEHAMIRFRERVEEEFLHRSDDDLSDLLNERIRNAALAREVVDPREPSIPTMLHLFESRTGLKLVAVVRDKTVVTVLDDWMARNNYPGWEEGSVNLPSSAPLAASIGDKIRALSIVPSPPALPSPPSPSSTPGDAVVTAPPVEQPDMYNALAAECRSLGQRLRALREHRSDVDLEIEAVLKDYDDNTQAPRRHRRGKVHGCNPCTDRGVKPRRRSDRERASRTARAHTLAGRPAVRLRAPVLQPLWRHDLGRSGSALRRQLDRLAREPEPVRKPMSVEIHATRRPTARRSGDLPCRTSAEDTAWAVMIRVEGRTFTTDCRDQEEATEVARRINAALGKHYARPTTW